LQNAINTNQTYSGASDAVSVSQNAGILTVSSNQFGSNSIADITGGDGLASLFGSTPVSANGLDVAGTINGQAATGSGQTLTSSSGSSSGLGVVINGGNLGSRGTVSYTQGYANSLNTYITAALGTNGAVAAAVNSYNSSVTDLQTAITRDNTINAQVQQSLQAEYSALDVTMSNLNSMSTNLTSELASLSSSSSSSSG
jgi:flagellar hook-associated protein 2